jgi:hypothetical protein
VTANSKQKRKREIKMAGNRAALLQKIAKSTVSSGGNNLLDGRGRLIVKRLALEDGFNGARFTAEFAVYASSKIPAVSLKTGLPIDISPNPVGSDVGIVNMLDKHESAFGAVKGLFLALYGETEVADDEFIAALDEATKDNTARGRAIDYETYRKITRENKVEIVLPKWFSVEQDEKDEKKMRAWLDSLTGVTGAVQAKA